MSASIPPPATSTTTPIANDPICPSQRALLPAGDTLYLSIPCFMCFTDAPPDIEQFYISPHSYSLHPLTADTLDQLSADLYAYASAHFAGRLTKLVALPWQAVGMSADSIAKRGWFVVPSADALKEAPSTT